MYPTQPANQQANNTENQPLRIGKISYLNTLPMVFNLPLEATLGVPVQWFEGPPADLNQAMKQGQLDVSLVSAVEFLRNEADWVLLPHLSISSFAPVQSVLWVADVQEQRLTFPQALAQFDEFPVTSDSASSVVLLKCLAQLYTGKPLFANQLKPYPASQYRYQLGHFGNALMIGDAALAFLNSGVRKSDCIYDLSQLWSDFHGGQFPFVFGVWVAQRAWANQHPELLARLVGCLQHQVYENLHNPAQKQALLHHAQRLGYQTPAQLDAYFSHSLSYELTPRHLQALQQFKQYLVDFQLL
ncbi:MAG: menaquinone biosynthesis protein [Candidatus Melainabacteria bacterium]|nr:menaquinone biosynthesis protein [Candidatus Melainabacteria bacterium]